MTAAALLETLRARGVALEAVGDRLRFRPREAVTPELREALARHKADLLALLNRPNRPAPLRAVETPAGAPAFAETVTGLLGLPLDRFAEAGCCLEVRVPWHPEPLWFVPMPTDAAALEAEGVSRGRVWTATELVDLLGIPGLTRDQARTVALAKLTIEGEVVGVHPRLAKPCPACHGRRWWRSIRGAVCDVPSAGGAGAGRGVGERAVPEWRAFAMMADRRGCEVTVARVPSLDEVAADATTATGLPTEVAGPLWLTDLLTLGPTPTLRTTRNTPDDHLEDHEHHVEDDVEDHRRCDQRGPRRVANEIVTEMTRVTSGATDDVTGATDGTSTRAMRTPA